MRKKRAVVALSGGVDSAFSAYLMLESGYEVIGIFLKLFGSEYSGWFSESRARKVAEFLKIPFYSLNFREKFEKKVISYFINSYLKGETPNPCIVCNRYIKFGYLLNKALELGGECLVTGHYARIKEENGEWGLFRGVDVDKDQSYFLFPLLEKPLSKIYFPLGEWRKERVHQEARRIGIPALFHESQEVCFLEGRGIKEFLTKEGGVSICPGPIITTEGKIVGEHPGVYFFTIGQRRGLKIKLGEPYYIKEIIPEENKIVIGKREEIYSSILEAEEVIADKNFPLKQGDIVEAKIRYLVKPEKAEVIYWDGRRIRLRFFHPQWAVTPGQAVVLYREDRVIAGGWIRRGVRENGNH
ncbi:tRNA 2-thiouridine(34) synthase MnmA [Candidatus Calescamantes bacterium]|nr:tRNA 2-thiouridine(34) synthase MnmA [Candidatus Calescamantes bacterium]